MAFGAAIASLKTPRAAVTASGISVRLVTLLTVASFINYVDRGSLAD